MLSCWGFLSYLFVVYLDLVDAFGVLASYWVGCCCC